MPSSTAENGGFRHKWRQRLGRFRHSTCLPQTAQEDPIPETNSASIPLYATPTANPLPQGEASAGNGDAQSRADESDPGRNSLEQNLVSDPLTLSNDNGSYMVPSDIWSAAYQEAVDTLGEEIDIAILKGKNVEQLFKKLEEIDKDKTQESAFLRGVKGCPEKLTESSAQIAISFATADANFANQIAEMLEQISYIDECDTLGQKADRKDIHKALVLVYMKLLEFYKVAFEILTRKGAKLIMKMILENDRLPKIVQGFLQYSETLRKLIDKATFEIVEDIKGMLYDDHIARWLGSDKMSRQSHYHDTLQDLMANRACEFLLAHANFIHWYHASDAQQLAILGDMGCGKTVSMAFLVDELRQRNEHQLPQPKMCYYYCRDDETGQAIYIFSALILSLLEQLRGLKKPFFEWYRQAQTSGIFDPATSAKALEGFLQKLLESIDRPVFILIDGLDECDEASRRTLLKLLKKLSQTIPGLKTIVSSRPQEEILEQLDGTPRMNIGSNAHRDAFIVEKTVEMQLPDLSPSVKALVIEKLSHLAQGSAMWTKMVTELIKVRKIKALKPMQSFLDEIPLPGKLSELYVTLLSRCTSNDPENLNLASTALKLLAVARRPLSILELAWAVALGVTQNITTVIALDNLVDYQRVMGLIYPFIASVDFNDTKKRQVRLVHQSVKEFIIKEWTFNPPYTEDPTSEETEKLSLGEIVENLDAFILDICIRYLLLDEINNRSVFSEEQMAIAELPQEIDLFNDNEGPVNYDPYATWESWEENMIRYDPTERGLGEFFIYASCHWVEHFGVVPIEPRSGLASIERLCQVGSTRLHNWIQQNCRPGCAIQPRFTFDSSLYDPLSITSLYGSEAMLRLLLVNTDFDKKNFHQNSAMRAADQILLWGDLPRLRIIFLDDRVGHELQNLDFFRIIMKNWSHPTTDHQNWDLAFDLVDYVTDKLVQEQWGNDLLCMAAGAGCVPIIRRLISSAQLKAELRSELLRESQRENQGSHFSEPTHQSIGKAILGNHVDVVQFLLGMDGIEAHLRHRNHHGENVLHLASITCNPVMFRLLVPRFQEGVHQADDQGETALLRIIKNYSALRNRYESVEILLAESGIDWNSYSWDGQQDPLRMAVHLGDLEMCSILIRSGNLNPLSALAFGEEGQMYLRDSPMENKENILPILQLLCTHANITSTDVK
ncbi:hypothetical protein UA08_06898 [Talaromyces atroroseus]|uniref:NACHT domain-containing protein n=1 Tax=Talaromyces atroroseus TaxID=1441469 RepID=A0A225A9Q2_TALAT|nr:hypothetical protein UA08_06898 [Talaromyces atroroseus]OKL57502.1 hypothetical protein UA08_06898 [Talaromyces atroroseus]